MYILQVKWNRDFQFSDFGSYNTKEEAIAAGKIALDMGDGAEVKDFRVIDNNNGEVVYPKVFMVEPKVQPKSIKDWMLEDLYFYKGWINTPSKLQPFHEYHGKNVIIARIGNKCKCILLEDLDRFAQFEIDPRYVAIGEFKLPGNITSGIEPDQMIPLAEKYKRYLNGFEYIPLQDLPLYKEAYNKIYKSHEETNFM